MDPASLFKGGGAGGAAGFGGLTGDVPPRILGGHRIAPGRNDHPPLHNEEHRCGCSAPGCKCKVMTVLPICTLVSSDLGNLTRRRELLGVALITVAVVVNTARWSLDDFDPDVNKRRTHLGPKSETPM